MAALDEAIMIRIRQALEMRNITALAQIGAELGGEEETAAVGERLSGLAMSFDFDALQGLIDGMEDA